ncbi:MAG: hypothetical protein HHJ12_05110 [Glaciimonas sp.]|nr:hypothetical protein [Glaciimonas sp.]
MNHLFRHVIPSLFIGCAVASVAAAAIEEKASQVITQVQPQAAGNHKHVHAVGPSEPNMQERATLLKRAEAALAAENVNDAAQAFERAGLILHAADAEVGLVRTYMQAGEYKQALSFIAHTAGAHLSNAEGAAFYAWLLHIGGQGVIAQRLLSEATVRLPGNSLLAAVRQQLRSPFPLAAGQLLKAPTRFAPYGSLSGLASTARVVGTGVLVDHGRRVLVPIATLTRSPDVWVRNGLGQMTKAIVEHRLMRAKIAVLRLEKPLPTVSEMDITERDAFPGSIAYSIEYQRSPNAMPSWPILTSGFVGQPVDNSTRRKLGIALPNGPRGGPAFDAAGRFIGIAVPGSNGADQLVSASRLRKGAGDILGRPMASPTDPHVPVDQIYESAMRIAVQIIATR